MGIILENKRFFSNFSKLMITNQFAGTHYGIDLVAFDGKSTRVDKIMAHDGGTVSYVGYDTYAGYIVEIKIDDVYVERYQHLAKDSITVKVGQTVKKGQIIATMGDTGLASVGAHLHWAIRENGKYINPEPYLDKDVKAAVQKSLKAGTKYELKSIPSYQSPDTKVSSGPRTGTYYIWSDQVDMGRIRMTNKPERVGVKGQVSFFVNVSDLTGTTTTTQTSTPKPTQVSSATTATKSLKAGTKYELKSIPSYQSPDTKASSGPRTGTYYIWSEQVDMGRIRMTNKPERVGVKGQVSFFVNVKDLA